MKLTMENVKTLWELLQLVVEKEEKRYSLHEFLLESTAEDRKMIQDKLVDADQKQFYEYMDGFNFVSEDEVYHACCEYVEKTADRPLSMWEMWDLREIAEDYMKQRNLDFDEDFDAREDENSFLDSVEDYEFENMDELIQGYLEH